MFMYKSVIFDLDGTLLDTLQDIRLAFNDALEAAGLPLSYSLKEVRNMIGKGADYLCHTGLGKFDNEENFLKLKGEYMWRYEKYQVEHTKPYPGIYETLLFLKERGIQLFVCSNKPDKLASEILSHCFKSQLFVYVQGHLENFPPKPHPASLNKIIDGYHLERRECLFVGDSETDLLTAKNGELDICLVRWGYDHYKEALLNEATYVIDKAKELVGIIL